MLLIKKKKQRCTIEVLDITKLKIKKLLEYFLLSKVNMKEFILIFNELYKKKSKLDSSITEI